MTDNNRALRLSSELGGTYQTEGDVEVVFGELEGYLYTLLGSSYGVVVLQVSFPPGQDTRRVATALTEDEALKTCIGQARGSALSEDCLQVEDDGLQILWLEESKRPNFGAFAPVLTQLIAILKEVAPGASRDCSVCATPDTDLTRTDEATLRICPACQECLKFQQAKLQALESLSESEDEGVPFQLPDSLSFRSMDEQSQKLKEEHDRDPKRYRRGLLGFVVLGQAALAASAGGVAFLLVAMVGLTAWLLTKSAGLAFLVAKVLSAGGKLVVLAIGLMAGLIGGLWQAIAAAFRLPTASELPGYRLERTQAPRLYEWLDDLADQVNAPKVDLVLLYSNCNCFAAELRDGRKGFRRVVAIGIPILETLEREELRSVMAHELAHLGRGDSRSQWIFRTVSSWMDIARRIEGVSSAGWLGAFARWYVPRFYLRAQVVVRHAEYQSDLRAASVIDPVVCARSLVKVSLLGQLYTDSLHQACHQRALHDNQSRLDILDLTREGVACLSEAKVKRVLRLALEEEPCWLDTHPVLSQRLETLGCSPPSQVCVDSAPADAALDLIEDYPGIRAQILSPAESAFAARISTLRRALEGCRRRVELARVDHASAFVALGRDLNTLDRESEALVAYDQALALDPNYEPAQLERIALLMALDRIEEAAESWRKLLEIEPDDMVKNLQAHFVFREANCHKEAAECLQRILAQPIDKAFRERLEVRLAKLKPEGEPSVAPVGIVTTADCHQASGVVGNPSAETAQ